MYFSRAVYHSGLNYFHWSIPIQWSKFSLRGLFMAIREGKTVEQFRGVFTEYIPPALDWVRDQVELYESSGGTVGTTLSDTGLPCIIVTHMGNKTGAVRKIPVMRIEVDNSYVLVASPNYDLDSGRPKIPMWVHNLRANPDVEIRDKTEVFKMRVREVTDDQERERLWDAGVKAYPPYNDYQSKSSREFPVFIAEPTY